MDYLAAALMLIFCTPLGCVGLFIFGAMLFPIIEVWRYK